MTPLIELKNVTKIYSNEESQTAALNGVSFSIPQGQFTAIMGPSGCGKSTLLHILGFLDEPTSGDFYFKGKNIKTYKPEEIAKFRNSQIGFIFQSYNLLKRTTVYDNTKLPLIYSDIPESKWPEMIDKALEDVSISHRQTHTPSQLSGGEKQRAAIARALVMNPALMLADEPTGNLDSKNGAAVLELLKKINDEHEHTIIMVTHDINMTKYADRLILMKDGKIEEDKYLK